MDDFTPSGRARRLFVEAELGPSKDVGLGAAQAHYVRHVVRLKTGETLALFNGRDGEWIGQLSLGRREALVRLGVRAREQKVPCDLDLLFAPLKHARLDYLVQKATELGAGRLRPVITAHTSVTRVNGERMRANAIEAAEQCGLLWVPEIVAPRALADVIANWDADRVLVFADESARSASPAGTLAALRGRPLGVLVGPEGGFSDTERADLLAMAATVPISLGPRIMRADTAAAAALTLVQALAGDWIVDRR